MAEPRSPQTFARENERVRLTRLQADAKLAPVERLEQTLRLSRFLAEAGRRARDVRP